jgi:hypothetical protein
MAREEYIRDRRKRKCIRTSHTLKKSQLIKELIEEGVYYGCRQES